MNFTDKIRIMSGVPQGSHNGSVQSMFFFNDDMKIDFPLHTDEVFFHCVILTNFQTHLNILMV